MKVQLIAPSDLERKMVQALIKVTGNLTDDMRTVLNDALLEIETQAKVNAPVKTGRYRASIHAVGMGMKDLFGTYTDSKGRNFDGTLRTVPTGDDPNTGYVGSNVEYAYAIEYGKEGNSEPWWGSYPITRAVEMKRDRIDKAMKNLKLRGMPVQPLEPNE
jgi:hypothetical protein